MVDASLLCFCSSAFVLKTVSKRSLSVLYSPCKAANSTAFSEIFVLFSSNVALAASNCSCIACFSSNSCLFTASAAVVADLYVVSRSCNLFFFSESEALSSIALFSAAAFASCSLAIVSCVNAKLFSEFLSFSASSLILFTSVIFCVSSEVVSVSFFSKAVTI